MMGAVSVVLAGNGDARASGRDHDIRWSEGRVPIRQICPPTTLNFSTKMDVLLNTDQLASTTAGSLIRVEGVKMHQPINSVMTSPPNWLSCLNLPAWK